MVGEPDYVAMARPFSEVYIVRRPLPNARPVADTSVGLSGESDADRGIVTGR